MTAAVKAKSEVKEVLFELNRLPNFMRWLTVSTIVSVLFFISACSKAPTPYKWNIPEGFPQPNIPKDNPMSLEKVALGEKLFFDHRLSANQVQACATCHMPDFSFAQPTPTSVGSTGEVIKRNALALVNVGYNGTFNWAHSGLTQLEDQIRIPLFNDTPIEMGVSGFESQIIARLSEYEPEFELVFDTTIIDFDLIIKALAAYVRSLTFFDSAFDRYAYQQDDSALSKQQIDGMNLFFSEKFECFHCHGGFNFSQSSQHAFQTLDLIPFHNTGLYSLDEKGSYANNDQGLADITLKDKDRGKFRAPTLRNIQVTAPYMHDGSIATLPEVIDFYAAGGRGKGINNPNKSAFVKGFEATDEEKAALLSFLKALTDSSVEK